MSHPKQSEGPDPMQVSGSPWRRTRSLVAAVTAVAAIGLVAGCGDDGGGDTSEAPSGGATPASGVGAEVAKFVGAPSGEAAGKGKTIKLGANLPLTGPGSYYGKVQSAGIKLGLKHIEAAGGPKFDLEIKDNKTGDPQAGSGSPRELGIAGTPLVLGSLTANLGAALPAIKQYKMLTFDPGGGTGAAYKGKDYFYGLRPDLPTNMFGGAFEWMKRHLPEAKSTAFVSWELGDEYAAAYDKDYKRDLAKYGLTTTGTLREKIGATDYSAAIAELNKQKPDVVLLGVYSLDPANFMKQFVNSGNKAKVILFELTADAAKAAGSTYDDTVIAADYFDPKNPTNDWGKLFAKEYKAEYGSDPDFYGANYYESTFILWDLVRRVIKDGGDLSKGEDFLKALESGGTEWPSVYGGEGATPGKVSIDLKTHSILNREMGVFEVVPGSSPVEVKRIANFNVGGAEYEELGGN